MGPSETIYSHLLNLFIYIIRNSLADVDKNSCYNIRNQQNTLTAMMTGSLPSSSSSSTTSSNGSLRPGPGANQDDQFVDDLVSRLLKEDTEDDLVSGLNSLLKQ